MQLDGELSILASTGFDLPNFQERFHRIKDEIDACACSEMACAGAIIILSQNLLKKFKEEFGKDGPWNEASFGSVIQAAANNFRHHEEWARTDPPNKKQLRSIRVLAHLLKTRIAENGKGHPFRDNLCPQILQALSGGGDFEEYARTFFAFAKNITGS